MKILERILNEPGALSQQNIESTYMYEDWMRQLKNKLSFLFPTI